MLEVLLDVLVEDAEEVDDTLLDDELDVLLEDSEDVEETLTDEEVEVLIKLLDDESEEELLIEVETEEEEEAEDADSATRELDEDGVVLEPPPPLQPAKSSAKNAADQQPTFAWFSIFFHSFNCFGSRSAVNSHCVRILEQIKPARN